jgi:valyl-tRNA synthetase
LWHRLGYGAEGSLIRESWPVTVSVEGAAEARAELDWVVGVVSEIRSIRSDFDIAYKIKGRLAAHMPPAEEARLRDRLARHNDILLRLGGLSDIEPAAGVSSGAEFAVSGDRFDLRFGDDFDFASAAPRLEKEFKRVAGEAQKAEAKLSSEVFISRAPEEIVQENRDRLAAAQTEMARLQAAIARITG